MVSRKITQEKSVFWPKKNAPNRGAFSDTSLKNSLFNRLK